MENLNVLFSVQFGHLLENYLFRHGTPQLEEDIRFLLQVKSLKPIFAGYNTPSTALIFELIRQINDPELTSGFLRLSTVLGGLEIEPRVVTKTETGGNLNPADGEQTVSGPQRCGDGQDNPGSSVHRLRSVEAEFAGDLDTTFFTS